jgi:predicted metal-binding protein
MGRFDCICLLKLQEFSALLSLPELIGENNCNDINQKKKTPAMARYPILEVGIEMRTHVSVVKLEVRSQRPQLFTNSIYLKGH